MPRTRAARKRVEHAPALGAPTSGTPVRTAPGRIIEVPPVAPSSGSSKLLALGALVEPVARLALALHGLPGPHRGAHRPHEVGARAACRGIVRVGCPAGPGALGGREAEQVGAAAEFELQAERQPRAAARLPIALPGIEHRGEWRLRETGWRASLGRTQARPPPGRHPTGQRPSVMPRARLRRRAAGSAPRRRTRAPRW